ncbi:MAG: MEKHLA domain-containing protein [Planctomycetaceae bacterium]
MIENSESPAPWQDSNWIVRSALLLNSFEHWTGRSLIVRKSPEADSERLFSAPFVVVAHGTEADPLLNYGNQTALDLWLMSLADFIGTPSRMTAEPMHRDERARLLERTRQHGYIDDYSGIRIASTGQRFRIHQATVWNVIDEHDAVVGQAAAFAEWTMIMPECRE